jgi:enoyl-CoA hydratase
MSEPAVLVERDDHVVTITLNRPDKRNAFNAEVLCRLSDAWDMIDADDGVRAAILTGAGGHFSAGADLDRLVGAMLSGKPAADEFEERIRKDVSVIFKGFLKEHRPATPIIAAVEGYCYAGGIEILQAFDVRVAAEGAQIAVSEVQRGLFPMGGSTVRLPRQIPWSVAMEMLITGEPISGRRAYEVGLVGHVVPDGTALARAQHQGVGARRRCASRGRRLPARVRAGHGGHGLRGREGGPPRLPREARPRLPRRLTPGGAGLRDAGRWLGGAAPAGLDERQRLAAGEAQPAHEQVGRRDHDGVGGHVGLRETEHRPCPRG